MAEEEKTAAEAEGGAATEEVVETVETTEDQPNPVEALAAKAGWSPKDKWTGEPDAWRSAEDFLLVGKERVSTIGKELKGVRATLDNMSRTSAAVLEQQLARQRDEIEARFASAVEEGDVEAARAARGDFEKLATAAPTAKAAPPPEALAFADKHASWFNKDRDATAYAAARCDHYARMGMSPAGQLQAAEKDTKEMFPTLFKAPAKAAATVAAPASRATNGSGGKKTFADMPSEAQTVAKDMASRGVIKSVDDYVVNYFKDERKVG